MAGVALGDIDGAFVCFCVAGVVLTALGWLWWRACRRHLVTLMVLLCGTHGACCLNDNSFTHTQLTQLFHTHSIATDNSCTHSAFTHNSLTHTHTHLSDTTLSHTHNFVTHTQHFHTQLFPTQLFHPHSIFTHNSLTNTHTQLCDTHNIVTHTQLFNTQRFHTHTTLSLTALSHNLSSTMSFFFPAFPISFSHLLSAYWKKFTCGVIRSFNFVFVLFALGPSYCAFKMDSLGRRKV